jgi:hypothetical protein
MAARRSKRRKRHTGGGSKIRVKSHSRSPRGSNTGKRRPKVRYYRRKTGWS